MIISNDNYTENETPFQVKTAGRQGGTANIVNSNFMIAVQEVQNVASSAELELSPYIMD
jgi:hypothetical protein